MVIRSTEVRFFENEKRVQEIISAWKSSNHELIQYYRIVYVRSLPRAAPDEILIEKSPQYTGFLFGADTGQVEGFMDLILIYMADLTADSITAVHLSLADK